MLYRSNDLIQQQRETHENVRNILEKKVARARDIIQRQVTIDDTREDTFNQYNIPSIGLQFKVFNFFFFKYIIMYTYFMLFRNVQRMLEYLD